jgi:hypothetical protein
MCGGIAENRKQIKYGYREKSFSKPLTTTFDGCIIMRVPMITNVFREAYS